MDLKLIAGEINEILNKRREEIKLSFIEEDHIYFMKNKKGKVVNDYPSVSTVIKKFYTPFDAMKKSLESCNGNEYEAELLRKQWAASGDYATNMGSRVHYELEKELVMRNGNYKEVRKPIFKVDDTQFQKSEMMIKGGKNFIDLMEERGAVLLDTEIVLGDVNFGYTGQPDKMWLMMDRTKTKFGLVTTDWKTNQPKNFEVQWYTVPMLPPFQDYMDTALSHYFIQLPLYVKLLLAMLVGSKYEGLDYFGSVVVLLKDDSNFIEYKVPKYFNETILKMDMKTILV